MISMHTLLGPFIETSSVRKAEDRAMLMSVRFSTPLSLNTLRKLFVIASAWGLQMNR